MGSLSTDNVTEGPMHPFKIRLLVATPPPQSMSFANDSPWRVLDRLALAMRLRSLLSLLIRLEEEEEELRAWA